MNEGIGRGPMTAGASKPATTLESLVGQINDRIRSISDRQQAVSGAIGRLLNPRPVPVGNENINAKDREPTTHEDQLQAIIRRLDQICSVEVDQADSLNSAV